MLKDIDTPSVRIKPTDEATYKRNRKIVSIISLLFLLAVMAFVGLVIGKPLIEFISEPQQFQAWAEAQGIIGKLALIGIMCLQIVISVLPGEIVEVGAGYTFGAIQGCILCLIGAAIGSTIVFLMTKTFGIRLVEAFVPREKINSLSFIKNTKKLNMLLFLIFFIPGTPKDLITYFIGLTPMKLSTFLLITSVARIPSVISSTIGGHALGNADYKFAIIIFVVTAVISLLGILTYRHIQKKQEATIKKTYGENMPNQEKNSQIKNLLDTTILSEQEAAWLKEKLLEQTKQP